jgi:hypothetical protein
MQIGNDTWHVHIVYLMTWKSNGLPLVPCLPTIETPIPLGGEVGYRGVTLQEKKIEIAERN